MQRALRDGTAAAALLALALSGATASAQKTGGVLKMYTLDSPASMSIHEESTIAAQGPMMPVFNNLVMFDQHVKQSSLQSVVPDLATSWSWNEDGTALTFRLRQGVKWHDGKPFTAADVKCTWDLLMETGSDKFRVNPRKTSFLPYLDGIEYTTIRNPATAVLAFVSGKNDMTFPNTLTVPLLNDIRSQMPQAICELTPAGGVNRHVLVNRDKPPFNNPDLRRAMALSLDRKAFIDIISEGQGEIGGVLQPPPDGLWGMPSDMLNGMPGYDPDVQKNRQQARQIMENLGYGPDNRLKMKVSTRDLPGYRDPAVLLIDQLKEVYIDGELETVDTTAYFPKIRRKDFVVGLNLQTSGPDPDPILDLFYGCGSSLNWDGYCNPEVDKLIEQQSVEGDDGRRRQLVWAIERKLAEDVARPIIFYTRGGTCWQPYVKNVTLMVNSIFNGNRREDWWLDR